MKISITKTCDGPEAKPFPWIKIHFQMPDQGGWSLLFNTRTDKEDYVALRVGQEIMRLLDDEDGNNVHHS